MPLFNSFSYFSLTLNLGVNIDLKSKLAGGCCIPLSFGCQNCFILQARGGRIYMYGKQPATVGWIELEINGIWLFFQAWIAINNNREILREIQYMLSISFPSKLKDTLTALYILKVITIYRAIYIHAPEGVYIIHWSGKHLDGGSEGLMGQTFKGFREKVRCQTKRCIFLMGHVKLGLFELWTIKNM